jgi:hypothetical protein
VLIQSPQLDGSITDSSGAISFGNENLSTTGTLAAGATTLSGDTTVGNGYGLVVGHTAQLTVQTIIPETQILGTTIQDSSMVLGNFSTTDALQPTFYFLKSGNASINGKTIVADNELIGDIRWMASDSDSFTPNIATFRGEVDDANPADDAIGGALVALTATTGGTLTEALRLDSSQNATFAGSISIPAADKLYLDGAGGTNYLYEESTDDVHLVVGGVAILQIDQALNSMAFG